MTSGEQTHIEGDTPVSGDEESIPAHERRVRLPLARMLGAAFGWALGVGVLGSVLGMALVSGAGWWWAPAAAGCAWIGGVVGLAAAGGWQSRTPVEWAGMLFLGQFVSLFTSGLVVWALLYSSPQPSSLVILPTVSVSFVFVWIAFARAYGASLRGLASGRGV